MHVRATKRVGAALGSLSGLAGSDTSTIQVVRYLHIADAIRDDIAAGRFGAGGSLPSESELGKRFSASRVTVRRALEVLRDDGLVTSRRGSGWFLAVDPVRQSLGRFATVEDALEAAGVESRREVLEFGFEPAPDRVRAELELVAGADVLRVRRRNFARLPSVRKGGAAHDEPFGVVTVWLPRHHGEALSRSDVEASTFYELLTRRGVALGAAVQTITAEAAGPDDVDLLAVPDGIPVLVCHRLTRDLDRRPVLFSEHRYPSHRTEFEVELPRVAPAGEGPVGLRLVRPGDGEGEPYPSHERRQGVRHA